MTWDSARREGDPSMKAWTLAAMACGAAVLAACAGGGDRGPRAEPIRALLSADALVYATFDTDGDMRISAAELEAGVARELTRADANGDGSLQPLEFQNWSNAALGGGQLPPYRLDFDRNVDNVITAEEFTTELTARARDYDADGDGVLTRAEFVRQVNQPRVLRPDDGASQMRERMEEERQRRREGR